MVGEHQIHATSVDIKLLTQILTSHSRTLTVPTRESVAPRRGPAHDMLRLSLLPQGEVGLILLLSDTSQFTALVLDVL